MNHGRACAAGALLATLRTLAEIIGSLSASARAYFHRLAPRGGSAGDTAVSDEDSATRFAQAQAFHQQGQLDPAEAIYQALLQKYPRHFDLLHLMGTVQGQRNNFPEAIRFIEQALSVDPNNAAAHGSRGNCLRGLGKYEDALASYARALALRPADADTLNNIGATLRELQRPDEALASYDRALAINPRHLLARDHRGAILRELQRPDEALASHDEAIRIDPAHATAHYHRGLALVELKRHEEALASYERALALRPDYADALLAHGAHLSLLNRHEDALDGFGRLLTLDPNHAIGHYRRGIALSELNRNEEALASYARAIAISPAFVEALLNHGLALQELNRSEEALNSYARALDIKPDFVEALYNRANALCNLQRNTEALACFDRALEVKPDFADALVNRSVLQVAMGRHADALAGYDRALALKPNLTAARINRGGALAAMGLYNEALECLDQAIELDPASTEARFNRSINHLLLGDFSRGWEEYEWRWVNERLRNTKRLFQQPLWLGKESLADKTILLHSEQGLGDTLQFCRYAKWVRALGARTLLQVPPPLLPLLAGVEGATQVLSTGEAVNAFDYHCPLLSLPLAFQTGLDTIPAGIPYIHSDAERVVIWKNRLGHKTRPRIGLAWSGNAAHINDHNRSIALVDMLALAEDWTDCVSLQKEVRAHDRAVLDSHAGVRHYGELLHDFSDTAALVELMDIVVTVDTSVAHLAGAMGKPVWLLLPFSPDWRWLLGREDSPWYPTARLFRQPVIGDWASVIQRVRAALARACR